MGDASLVEYSLSLGHNSIHAFIHDELTKFDLFDHNSIPLDTSIIRPASLNNDHDDPRERFHLVTFVTRPRGLF